MRYAYVILNEQQGIYIGRTNNLSTRLESHNEGRNRSTRGHQWELVYYEAYKSSEDAREREKQLKHSGQAKRWLMQRIARSLTIGRES